ncbi:NAD-dependent succinate-semialdehyde dehydrogenase [Microbacterium sp. 22303]|uniref:NAD-dependent succinate-semialdehyde dehydrogenase n=1 Tax=Microbacterium sp. 22303 TaxID=3453905 RepID=UPI003F8398D5
MTIFEESVLTDIPTKLYIGGAWVDGEKGTIDVHNPATGEVLATVANASPRDGIRALDAAIVAQQGWERTSARTRSDILRRAFDLLQERATEFATVMTLEMGKPYAEALGEIAYGSEFLRWFSEEAVRVSGRFGANPEGTGNAIVSHHPVGPCFLITPWNFPLAMATRKIAPALAAGCTVVIKPAELTPLTTLLFVQLLEDAGVPAGVVNVLTTSTAAAVSAPIIADPRLRKLSFTGSTAVGQRLIEQSAHQVLRTSMELGGNAPFIVFDDAELDKAVDAAMLAKFRNVGQACTAANRFLVHRSLATEFSDRIAERVRALKVGPGIEAGVDIGALINDAAVAKADSLVREALQRGARLRVGGAPISGPGSFYEPTLLDHVHADSKLLREEVFGPVLAIVSFDDEDEAVRIANATEYGLVSYVFTESLDRTMRMISALQTGMMGVNAGVVSNASAPFGGVKQSGLGREGGIEGIHEYLFTKYTLIPR